MSYVFWSYSSPPLAPTRYNPLPYPPQLCVLLLFFKSTKSKLYQPYSQLSDLQLESGCSTKGGTFSEKMDSPSLRISKLTILPQLGVELHADLPSPCWNFVLLALDRILCMLSLWVLTLPLVVIHHLQFLCKPPSATIPEALKESMQNRHCISGCAFCSLILCTLASCESLVNLMLTLCK